MQALAKKTEAELAGELITLRDRLWALKRDLAQGKVKNVKEIKKVKRTIAQILTVRSSWKEKSER